ncbi:inorganic anion sulfate permease family protein [Cystoisospora suis]|uniref:Inorganic anion sulfate permease family protein n=1 Tax=Cystoisospora suis TaxID=483139 RepID=A0A2C6KZ03_9APIC|nr:inorganic anion sulfate permease family protein [Cystoisospora suis]
MESCYVSIPGNTPASPTARSGVPRSSGNRHTENTLSVSSNRADEPWSAPSRREEFAGSDPRASFASVGSSSSIVRSHYSYFASSPRRMSLPEPSRGSRARKEALLGPSTSPIPRGAASTPGTGGSSESSTDWGVASAANWAGVVPSSAGPTSGESDAREVVGAERSTLLQRLSCSVVSLLLQTHVIFMGILIAVLDNMPYATLLFPATHAHLVPIATSGVLVTVFVSQIVLGLFSAFPFAVGAFTVENVPFLRSISLAVIRNAAEKGQGDEWVLSTSMACWILASLLTALTFYALGAMKLGRVADFIPHTVLLGCIGGMGLFILTAAIGIAADCEWQWNLETVEQIFSSRSVYKVALTLFVEVILIVAEVKYSSPTFTPCFLLALPVVFYVVFFLFGISVERARETGWVFDGVPTPSVEETELASVSTSTTAVSLSPAGAIDMPGAVSTTPFKPSIQLATLPVSEKSTDWSPLISRVMNDTSVHLPESSGKGYETSQGTQQGGFFGPINIYESFSFACIDWRCVFSQSLSMLAIVVFSVLHAPINVPSLSLTTSVPSSLDYELKVHGLANVATALAGGLQCYMTYSTSTLLWKCGIHDHLASLLVGVGTAALVIFIHPMVILTYFPRPAAAVFMLHVGVVLVNDGLIASWSIVTLAEYVIIVVTAVFMQAAFTDGLLVGLLLSAILKVCRAGVARARRTSHT